MSGCPSIADSDADRRRWPRCLSAITQVSLRIPGADWIEAQVLDESLGGIGLVIADDLPLQSGAQLEVLYEGVPLAAEVRHLVQLGPQRRRVGLQWIPVPSQSPTLSGSPRLGSIHSPLAADPDCGESIARFVHEIHHAVHKLRGLQRFARWDEAAEMAAQVRVEAEVHGFQQLVRHAASVAAATPSAPFDRRLDDLIAACDALSAQPQPNTI